MEKILHLKIQVFGQVQGVGFRSYAKRKAKDLNLVGFVENRPNGSVYLEAEGSEENLNEFLAICQKGPFTASVETVESEFSSEIKNYTDFEIK